MARRNRTEMSLMRAAKEARRVSEEMELLHASLDVLDGSIANLQHTRESKLARLAELEGQAASLAARTAHLKEPNA